jgi:hypothetical protein
MRWAIISGTYNVADLVTEFCRYHLSLGVDRIFTADYGSDDGTLELLQPFVLAGQVQLVTLPTHHFASYDPSNAILGTIRETKAADWVSFLDPDEFLTGPDNIKELLSQKWSRGVKAIAVPRHNLTGIAPLPSGSHYLNHLTLKVVKTDARVSDPGAPLSSPWIFSRQPPKVMIDAQSSLMTTIGDHGVRNGVQPPQSSVFEILHFPIRGYEAFLEKIECGREYYANNPELEPRVGWHWRRWIAVLEKGQLREEYESQFLDPPVAESLLAQGRIVRETRLADSLRSVIR